MSELDLQLADALARAEKAERREEQFRNWWTGVSKQLDDLRRQHAREGQAREESCETHGPRLAELDTELWRINRRRDETERARVKLVVGLQTLRDLVTAWRDGQTRQDLTVDELMGTVGSIVGRTLGERRTP